MKYLDKWTQTWRVHLKLYAQKLNPKAWRLNKKPTRKDEHRERREEE